MKQKVFDILRWFQIIVPLLGAFYAALAGAWGLPYAESIVTTCAAVTGLLGGILKADSKRYFKDKEIIPVE